MRVCNSSTTCLAARITDAGGPSSVLPERPHAPSLYEKWIEIKRSMRDSSHLRPWVEDLAEVLGFELGSPDQLDLRRRKRKGLASDFRKAVTPVATAIVDALLCEQPMLPGAVVFFSSPDGCRVDVIHEGECRTWVHEQGACGNGSVSWSARLCHEYCSGSRMWVRVGVGVV